MKSDSSSGSSLHGKWRRSRLLRGEQWGVVKMNNFIIPKDKSTPWTLNPFIFPLRQQPNATAVAAGGTVSSQLSGAETTIEGLGQQFLQRCSVSGTAKGKGKVKPGQQLKRSKITRKKVSDGSSVGGSGGGRKSSLTAELEEMAAKCLAAPTPIRFLKPKQREREAEREKLGLISKDRQREIEMLKKQAKEGTGFEKPMIIGTPGLDLISLGLVNADDIPKYDLTVEDGRRLAKEYSRVLMRRHRARQKAESTLLRLKKEAIQALPEHLKAAALVPDLAPFPSNRFMATLTPPIEGYIDKIKEAAKQTAVKEKLR
ncbi:hypothetical protein Nepgr_023571 [Nepenthes gracilis]|uniref:Uncharacterized protein n=1 Tax=Nepenthes gracilis TaxID=150966 RepID=A0AAD3T329_NEPGR|nr:hypothetical protein Nepgr_023571 [Nepenthes gracilis]